MLAILEKQRSQRGAGQFGRQQGNSGQFGESSRKGSSQFGPDQRNGQGESGQISQNGATQSGQRGQNGFESMGSGTPDKKTRSNRGMLWILDGTGKPSPLFVKAGATDGRLTEISSRMELKEGMKVITGIETAQQSKKKQISLLPTRGPGRGH